MLKKIKNNLLFRQVLLLIAIPLTLTSTGYAIFSQQLSVSADATKPAYSRSQNLSITYTKQVAFTQNKWEHSVAVSIKNNGTKGVTAWQSDFSFPADFIRVTCTNATCSQSGTTNVAVNTGTNGTIAAGATVTYDFSFQTDDQNYAFTSIAISGTPEVTYATVSGLSVNYTAGTRTKAGKNYTWPYTFTVTNNSGQSLAGWRIQCPWSTTTTVSSMSTTVDYTTTATQLSIFSKQAIVSPSNFQFNASLTTSDINYVLTGCTIQGQV